METVLQDLRYAARMLVKNPGFTLVAVVTLALGIGANTAIFSVVDRVLLNRLPYTQPDRLVMIWGTNPLQDREIDLVSPADFEDWRKLNTVFEDLAASRDAAYSLTGMGEPETITGYRFAGNFFRVLGVNAAIGRTFAEDDDGAGSERVVVLGHKLWQRRFGGDPSVIGRSITLSGNPYTIIGVMPAGFAHPQTVEMWAPLKLATAPPQVLANRQRRFLRVMARLKPGVTLHQAQAEMDQIAIRLQQENPQTNAAQGVKIVGIREQYAGDARTPLLVLLGAVGFVLLIACANIANLFLARAASRQKEIAIRLALGAARGRLIRQFLTESVLLSLIGGACGLVVSLWSTGFLVSLFPKNIANLSLPQVDEIPINSRVMGFTVLVALATGILFGLVPAVQSAKVDLNNTLKETGSSVAAGLRSGRFRGGLVVAEMALALVLLIGAGLMIKSFWRLQQADLGLNTHNVLTMEVQLPDYKYSERQKRQAFLEEAMRRIESLPGVQSAGAINFLPLTGFWGTSTFTIEGQPTPPPGAEPEADNRLVTENYFRTVGMRLLKGRTFTEQDTANAPHVAILNETAARRFFPDQDPIGKRINQGDAAEPNIIEIIGVVNDVKAFGLEEETHVDLYRPFAQSSFPLIAFAVRTAGDPMSLVSAVTGEIWSVDKDQPVFKIIAMDQLAAESTTLRRVSMSLVVAFAMLALVLATVGIYGVISYSVSQRTHEIGLRMALGAQGRDVLKMLIKEGLLLALIGVGLGLGAGIALTRFLSSVLYGVGATDPATFILVPILLIGVAMAACFVPARRATKVDPMVALRYE
jgi:putative ABC transport system permease protein